MSESCGCSFSNEEIENLLLLEKSILVERGIKMINVLPKENLGKIIRIASLLPSPSEMKTILIENEKELSLGITKPFENLRDTVGDIRVAISQIIKEKPYKYPIGTIEELLIVIDRHSIKGREHWIDELSKTLFQDEDLKTYLETWSDNSKSIKKLIEVFDLPEEKIKTVLEELVQKRKGENPFKCLKAASLMDISVDPEEYQTVADALLKEANKERRSGTREQTIKNACNIYQILQKYGLKNREETLKVFLNENVDYEKGVNKVIRTASKILNFKYKKQGLLDIGW